MTYMNWERNLKLVKIIYQSCWNKYAGSDTVDFDRKKRAHHGKWPVRWGLGEDKSQKQKIDKLKLDLEKIEENFQDNMKEIDFLKKNILE